MNKSVILSALQSQLETLKTACQTHEQDVYEPAVAKLTKEISEWFSYNIVTGVERFEINSDSLVIYPTYSTSYGSDITISYRCNWNKENAYFECRSYRPELDSREDNSKTVFYYTVMAKVADCFTAICNQYETVWLPIIEDLKAVKGNIYNEIYKVEREISNCEYEIAESEKEVYNKSGFECTLKSNYEYSQNDDGVYYSNETPHTIRAQYGRSKWDYVYVNSFKVVNFPKSRFGKVVIEYKGDAKDAKVRTIELTKQRFAEFIDSVYYWQSQGSDKRKNEIIDRITRWNKVEA